MKKSIFISIALLLTFTISAKKVKFEVDMTDQTISTYGVHVAGDFQAVAGYPGGDWQPGTSEMINEPGTQIYSVVVEIPAFSKYEYKFLNGDQWYDVEFVPQESRVGYNFNDNRWIFVDSITNDTTTTFPILFPGNAPAGLKLLRFKVDMQKESVSPGGVHVAGTFQGWDPAIYRLYDFDTTIYEFIAYVGQGEYEYKYFNGNTPPSSETVPVECAVDGNRWVNIVNDTIVEVVCFAECSACVITKINEIIRSYDLAVYPNPAESYVCIKFNDNDKLHDLTLVDFTGKVVMKHEKFQYPVITIETTHLNKGIYIIKSENEKHVHSMAKLVIE
jgi:alpha-amylase